MTQLLRLAVSLWLGLSCTLAFAKTDTVVAEKQQPPGGLAIGVEVGEPSAVTVRYAISAGRVGLQVGVGSGIGGGMGLQVHGDLTFGVIKLSERAQIYVGLGARYFRHTYKAATVDEVPDTHLGVRLPVGITAPVGNLELYLQAAPGYDVDRSESCSLASGADSLCPHAVSTRLFVHATVGARYYF